MKKRKIHFNMYHLFDNASTTCCNKIVNERYIAILVENVTCEVCKKTPTYLEALAFVFARRLRNSGRTKPIFDFTEFASGLGKNETFNLS